MGSIQRVAYGSVGAMAMALGGLVAGPVSHAVIDETTCVSYITIEADTGIVISEFNADEKRPAASMVKMVMMLMVSEGIDLGLWDLDTPIIASANAERMGGTQVFLKAGEERTVSELSQAIAVVSANDAATALAEGLWGSEETYLHEMNRRIQELGMIDSKFHSVNGLPPDPGKLPDQTTARDMAILAQYCVRDPRIMNWVNQQEMVFRPGEAVRYNTNKLLWRGIDCDGLKTGYTRAAGFCLTATGMREGIRVVSVVMGCGHRDRRFDMAAALLDSGLAQIRRVPVLTAGEALTHTIPVTNSIRQLVRPLAVDGLTIVARQGEMDRIELVTDIPDRLEAPMQAGTVLGEIRAVVDGEIRGSAPLVLDADIPEAGWRWKLVQGAMAAQTAEGG